MVLANLWARLQDIFNETCIILGAQSSKTLAFTPVPGVKSAWTAIMHCCNGSGNEHMKLLMVAKAKRPHCFGSAQEGTSFSPDTFMHYFGHPCAWSTRSIWN